MAALSQIKAPPPKPTEAPRATVGPQMGTGVIAQPPRPAQTISMPPQSVPQSAPLTMPPMMYQPPMGGGYAPMGSNPYMMPPNMGGAPMGMAPQHPRPDAEDESPFKRQRNDEEGASTAAESKLMAEDEWLMNHPVSADQLLFSFLEQILPLFPRLLLQLRFWSRVTLKKLSGS